MLRIIYAGTPEFAVPALQALAASSHQVVAVYTQPDRPAGRGRRLQPGPVKQAAVNLDIPVFQPASLRQVEEVEHLKALQADLMVVAAYGLILPGDILEAPRLGCINIHASLLPRWRGAAPIQRAILAGDRETGITIMKMAQGLDTGDMLARQPVIIDPEWNAGDLHDRLMQVGADLLIPTIDALVAGRLAPEVQDEALATYAEKLLKSEAEIDWSKDATMIHREIRAYAPWPVSFSRFEGEPVRIWRATSLNTSTEVQAGQIVEHDKSGLRVSCGNGVLEITELQFSGRKKCHPAQLLGNRNLTGLVFG